MEGKSKRRVSLVTVLFVMVLAATIRGCFSAASQLPGKKRPTQPAPANRLRSSFIFPVQGNVYPLGYYSVSVSIGNPPKLYDLDIDTGSDLTWVQCDAPCTGCTKPRDQLYKPRNNILSCADPICSAVPSPANTHCEHPNDQCDYEVEYADQGSSLGVLVTDYFPLRLSNGSLILPRLTFGCGYDQKHPGPIPPPPTAGVLGLGHGKASIVSQLQNMGLTQNVIGHCFSSRGGGFLFFGENFVPPSGITWTPMSRNPADKHYSSGPAELLFGGSSTGIKGLELIFDSGSSYSYFSGQVYQSILKLIKNNLNGKPIKDAPEDKALSVCWKGAKPFKSVSDAKSFFKPLVISFTNSRNVQLQLAPEDYLIVTKLGNVCLGILDGGEAGVGKLNIIGDIFMQDKMVIYDNEKQQIGWVLANCNRLPKF